MDSGTGNLCAPYCWQLFRQTTLHTEWIVRSLLQYLQIYIYDFIYFIPFHYITARTRIKSEWFITQNLSSAINFLANICSATFWVFGILIYFMLWWARNQIKKLFVYIYIGEITIYYLLKMCNFYEESKFVR